MDTSKPTLFEEHMAALRSAGKSESPYEAKKEVLSSMTVRLASAKPDELQAYGKSVSETIRAHEKLDTLDIAQREGRLLYRSWHDSEAGEELDGKDGHFNHFGKSSTADLTDPVKFREHKDAIKRGDRNVHYASAPSTLTKRNGKTTVFALENATVAALQPENHYAAFFAFNEAAKSLEKSYQEGGEKQLLEVGEQARHLRASVTRPEFFSQEDLGTYVQAQAPENDLNPKARRRHGTSDELDIPKYKSTGIEKLGDEKRIQAIFYNSFIESVEPTKEQHNEMTVKYRQSGKLTDFTHRGEFGLMTDLGGGGRGDLVPEQLTEIKGAKHPRISKK